MTPSTRRHSRFWLLRKLRVVNSVPEVEEQDMVGHAKTFDGGTPSEAKNQRVRKGATTPDDLPCARR